MQEWMVRSLTNGNEAIFLRRVWNATCQSGVSCMHDEKKNRDMTGEENDNDSVGEHKSLSEVEAQTKGLMTVEQPVEVTFVSIKGVTQLAVY